MVGREGFTRIILTRRQSVKKKKKMGGIYKNHQTNDGRGAFMDYLNFKN